MKTKKKRYTRPSPVGEDSTVVQSVFCIKCGTDLRGQLLVLLNER